MTATRAAARPLTNGERYASAAAVAERRPTDAAHAEAVRALTPNPGPQTALVECTIKDTFYGGARFGGKTYGLGIHFHAHATRWGKYARGILFRRTFPELEEVIRTFRELFEPIGWTYTDGSHTFRAPTGATLKLRYLQKKGDARRYQGHSYTWLAVDEVGEFPDPGEIDELWGVLRSVDVPMPECQRILTGNPGGVGQAWVHQRYVANREPFVAFDQTVEIPGRPEPLRIRSVFIPAKLEDNAAAMTQDGGATYEAQLALAGSTALYNAWRWGNWDAFVGQAFPEWDRAVHVVPTRKPPRHVPLFGGLDWGWHQGWMGLAFRDADGRYEVCHEIYFDHLYAREAGRKFAERWERAEIPAPEVIYYDDQMEQEQGVDAGATLIQQFRLGLLDHYGTLDECPKLVAAAKGKGSRKLKYDLMHEALAFARSPDGTVAPWQRPHLVVQARCTHLIRTLPALVNDPDKPGDVDTDGEDHPYDGACNILLSRHRKAERTDPRGPQERHPGIDKKGRKKKWADDEDAGASLAGDDDGAPGYDPGYQLHDPRGHHDDAA